MSYESVMTASDVVMWEQAISYYGFFSWKVVKSFLVFLALALFWVSCFLNFIMMFTRVGKAHYVEGVFKGTIKYNYGATLVTSWFLAWFVGMFAHVAVFDGVVGYFLHSTLPADVVYTIEAGSCKFLTLAGLFYA